MADTLRFATATADEEKLVERRALETLIGFLALRWRKGWADARSHCFVARLDGEVVSSLMALELPVYWPIDGGTEIRQVAGLDAIVTASRHRRHGYAGRLLEWVNAWAAERGLAGTALFSEIGTAYYAARGYRLVPMSFLRGPISDPDAPAGRELEAAGDHPGEPFNSVDLPRVAAAYSAAAQRYPLSVARDLEYWEYQLDHNRFVEDLHSDDPDPRDFTVSVEDPTAYVRSRSDGDIFTVLEAVCEPGGEEALDALLTAELDRGAREGCLRTVLHLPPGARIPKVSQLREASYETFMVRPAPEYETSIEALLNGSASGIHPYMFRPDYF